VRSFVERGLLVPLNGNSDYQLSGVSFPYARAAVKLFVERLAPQYKAACGEKLVVTSLTRPLSRQPRNASDLSVHPAGMAVDFRQSKTNGCRRWLEETLANMEESGLLEATKERRPAHYHIAVFPEPYTRYAAKHENQPKLASNADAGAPMKIAQANTTPSYASIIPVRTQKQGSIVIKSNASFEYTVRRGDNLWSIARKFGLKAEAVKAANHLRGTTIQPGQKLTIPGQGQGTD
jgi:hypothetical protein